MSGQFGSARAQLEYETDFNTVLGGFSYEPSDGVRVSFDTSWNAAEAAFDPFVFPEGEAFAAARPNQSFDFSQTHLNSDLDTTYFEAALRGRFQVGAGWHLTASYRYIDFDDDAPYLGDDSGSVDFFGLGLARSF